MLTNPLQSISPESGTGLGLAICERIVMAHEGKITFESNEGVCTNFIIKLLAAQEPHCKPLNR